jgi:translocator protein
MVMKQDKSYVFSSLGCGFPPRQGRSFKHLFWGLLFGIGLFFLAGFLMTGFGQSGRSWQPWYDGLVKSSWTPPSWVFSPVWFVLYSLMGVTWGRLFQPPVGRYSGMVWLLWTVQTVLNLAWSPLFFQFQSPFWALSALVGLILCLGLFLIFVSRRDRLIVWLNMPYLAWTIFALWLNFVVVVSNENMLPRWLAF